ncbi:hypothetical protein BPC006_II1915 [Burkholderia pseudomallei BPC006]|nr:hypothetical protein BPC006_II1915 [Burkholderia pseudomallei BPC006]
MRQTLAQIRHVRTSAANGRFGAPTKPTGGRRDAPQRAARGRGGRGVPRCAPALRADAFIPRLRDAASLAARLAVAQTACARPRAWSALSTAEFWSRDTCRFSPDAVPRQRFAHVGFPQTHSPAIAAIAAMRVRPAAATRCRSCRARTKKKPRRHFHRRGQPMSEKFHGGDGNDHIGRPAASQPSISAIQLRRARSGASGRRAYR